MPPPRPHPLTRSPLVDQLDSALENSWQRGWLPLPQLDAEGLWAKASRGFDPEDESGGRSPEDVADFRERLAKLTTAIAEEAQLNSLGKTMAHGQLVRVIRQRLGLGKMWREQPELLETTLAAPILVIGQMRSGTTRLHRLLAADPAHAATRFCDSWHPVPTSSSWQPDMRPFWSGFALFMARRIDPWIDMLHPFGAARHDEELGWMASALDHSAYEAQWRVPSYTAFSEGRDPAPVYREFARILRTDAASHGNAALPRVMKVPQFSEELDAVLAQFPDARVVLAERDDEGVARSSASLVANQMTIQSDECDMDWIESEWHRKIALRHERTRDALADFDGPTVTANFELLGRDWRSAIESIYETLGLDLTPDALAAMEAEMKRADGDAHHGHAAQLKSFERDAA